MATKTGTVQSISTDPRGFQVNGVAFVPENDDQWNLAVAAWGGGKTITVTYNAGPPVVVTKVSS